MSGTRWLVGVCVALWITSSAQAYPNGAGHSSCLTLVPGHTGQGISSPVPYSIRIVNVRDTYSSGQLVTAVITSYAQGFKGLLVQVRPVTGYQTNRAVGYFAFPNSSSRLKTLSCWSTADSVTNAISTELFNEITVEWVAPATNVGDVVFVATIVKEKSIWYTGLQSAVLRYQALPSPSPALTELPPLLTRPGIIASASSKVVAGPLVFFLVFVLSLTCVFCDTF